MANEAVIIELGPNGGNPVMRTVAEGTSISKGTILIMTDPNTAAATTATSITKFAGIAAADKLANDGSSKLAAYMSGVFDLTSCATETPTVGAAVCISGANLVRVAVAADLLSGGFCGWAEEDASASEVIRVRLRGI